MVFHLPDGVLQVPGRVIMFFERRQLCTTNLYEWAETRQNLTPTWMGENRLAGWEGDTLELSTQPVFQ